MLNFGCELKFSEKGVRFVVLNKDAFARLVASKFNNSNSQAAKAFGVTPQCLYNLTYRENSKAGAELLGGIAAYCFREKLNFWDYVFLPNN